MEGQCALGCVLNSRRISKMVQQRLEEVEGVGLTFLIPQNEHPPDVLNKEGLKGLVPQPFRGLVDCLGLFGEQKVSQHNTYFWAFLLSLQRH